MVVLVTGLGVRLVAIVPGGDAGRGITTSMARAGERLAWLPSGWAGRAVVAAGDRDLATLALYGGLTLAFALAAGFGSFAVFGRTFVISAARLRAAATPRPRPRAGIGGDRLLALLPRQLSALIVKEWLTIGRDLRRLSGAVWPLGMAALYAVTLGRNEAPPVETTPALLFWLAVGPVILVPWAASLGIAIYAVGTERRNIHLLRLLPVTPSTILLAKIIASALPVVVLSEAAAIGVALTQRATLGQTLGLVALVAWASAGYVTIDTAGAAIAPNFEAKQVQRATGFLGRAVSFAAGVLFTITSAAAICRLIFFATGVPAPLRPYFGFEVLGVALLGWPLVALGGLGAVLTIAFAFSLAEDRLAQLVRVGV